MGFFDALKEGAKKLTDRVTGGYGEIEFDVDKTDLSPGDPLSMKVTVTATGELKAKRVLVRLRGIERIEIDVQTYDQDGDSRTRSELQVNNTLEKEYELFGELEMDEGETRTFEEEIIIPEEAQPSYDGIGVRHYWEVEANVDVPWGKDPKKSIELYIR